MTINEVYKLVAFVFNKEQSGHLSPEDFNIAIYSASRELFDDKRVAFESTQKVLDELRPFIKQTTGTPNSSTGILSLPADYGGLLSVYVTSNTKEVDLVRQHHWPYRINSEVVPPTSDYPVMRFATSDQLEFKPSTIGGVTIDYFSFPIQPEWAYTVSSGVALFDVGNSTDVEWGDNMINELATRVLIKFGVSLKDSDVTQYANAMKQQEPI